jgi:hypothetical protein
LTASITWRWWRGHNKGFIRHHTLSSLILRCGVESSRVTARCQLSPFKSEVSNSETQGHLSGCGEKSSRTWSSLYLDLRDKFNFLKCWMFSFEGWRLLLQLGRPLWRPRESGISNIFSCSFFPLILFIKNLDPDPYPDSLEMLDPDPDPQHCLLPTFSILNLSKALSLTQLTSVSVFSNRIFSLYSREKKENLKFRSDSIIILFKSVFFREQFYNRAICFTV